MKGFADFKHKIHDVCGRFKIEINLDDILDKISIVSCEDSILVLDCSGNI